MLASDTDLTEMIAARELIIEPAHDDAERDALVQPASVDLRLGQTFQVFRSHGVSVIDPALGQRSIYEEVYVQQSQTFILHPGQFALGTTYETITLGRSIGARVEGKSSLGRLGLMIHSTAGYVDPGFAGEITLEMSNLAPVPIVLRPGMAIAQLAVTTCRSAVTRPYGSRGRGSHYQGQAGATTSRSWEHFRVWPLQDRRQP